MLSARNRHRLRCDLVAVIGYGLQGQFAQNAVVQVALALFTGPAHHFFANLDPHHPAFLGFVPKYFRFVCLQHLRHLTPISTIAISWVALARPTGCPPCTTNSAVALPASVAACQAAPEAGSLPYIISPGIRDDICCVS